MDARHFIDTLAAGQSSEAKDALAELLSAKAFDALEARKKEIASTLFGGENTPEEIENETEIEVQDSE